MPQTEEPLEEIPRIEPAPKRRGRPPKAKTDAPTVQAKPAKKPPTRMPVPKAFTDGLADLPYIGIGMAYSKKTGRPLVIPGAGDLTPMVAGPEQLATFYKAGREAWDVMVKDWSLEMPPWLVYIMSIAVAAGGAAALDQLTAMKDAIAQMTPAQQAEIAAKMKASGVKMPEVMRNGAAAEVTEVPLPPPVTVD